MTRGRGWLLLALLSGGVSAGEFDCIIEPSRTIEVRAASEGLIEKIWVDRGDSVKAGQVLVTLDSGVERAATEAARYRSTMQGRIRTGESRVEFSTAKYNRREKLAGQSFISLHDRDEALTEKRLAESELIEAKDDRRLAEIEFRRLSEQLRLRTIRSPVDGVVVDRVVDLGQTVAASFQTPVLIKIAQDLSEMRIDTSFAEADIGLIREGQKARFTVDAFPNKNFSGDVQQIRLNPTNQQNVVTYNVRINVANPDHVLLPGMTAYVNIGVARREDVLLVPNGALRFKPAEAADKKAENGQKPASTATAGSAGPSMAPGMGAGMDGGGMAGKGPGDKKGKKRDGQSGTVYVLEGGEIKPVSVQLGITDNRNTEVVGGDLKAGDRVVTGENVAANNKPSSVGMRMF